MTNKDLIVARARPTFINHSLPKLATNKQNADLISELSPSPKYILNRTKTLSSIFAYAGMPAMQTRPLKINVDTVKFLPVMTK